MPSINLISVQRAQKRVAERKTRALFFGWVGEGVFFLLATGFLLWRSSVVQAQLSEVNARGQKLAPLQMQIRETEKQIAEIAPKMSTLQNARKGTERWERVLNHISVNTPTSAWVTSLKSEAPKDDKSPLNMSLAGFAADQNLVGEVMLRLNSSNDLNKVELKYSQRKTVLDSTGVEFEVGAQMNPLEVPNADKDKAKGGETNAKG